MLEAFGFSVKLPSLIVFREDVGHGADIVKLNAVIASEPCNVLPHAVFPAKLVGKREVVQTLELGYLFQVLGLHIPSPLDIPFCGAGCHKSSTRNLKSIDNRVVNVGRFVDFKARIFIFSLELFLRKLLE